MAPRGKKKRNNHRKSNLLNWLSFYFRAGHTITLSQDEFKGKWESISWFAETTTLEPSSGIAVQGTQRSGRQGGSPESDMLTVCTLSPPSRAHPQHIPVPRGLFPIQTWLWEMELGKGLPEPSAWAVFSRMGPIHQTTAKSTASSCKEVRKCGTDGKGLWSREAVPKRRRKPHAEQSFFWKIKWPKCRKTCSKIPKGVYRIQPWLSTPWVR